ncbi:hypothetical protein EBR21_16935, partial [bacterium]|nr:hypothetical protein [bacterium]
KDGVTKIVLINKGAQFSQASSGENMVDVLKYFRKHPDYDAEAVGVTWYANDQRFTDVVAKSLDADVKAAFPDVPNKDIYILLGSHGLPKWLINTGDSAVTQMKKSVVEIRAKMPQYKIYHGFLNDDFFPGAKWVGPKASVLAPQLAKDGCKNVAMDGRRSFTTHHRATLFDLNELIVQSTAQAMVKHTAPFEFSARDARTIPLQIQTCAAEELEVIDPDLVKTTGQIRRTTFLDRSMQSVVVDDSVSIDLQTASVIGL